MTTAALPKPAPPTIDKSTWGDGPWQTEPDLIYWRDPITGYDCLILRSTSSGGLCGYVGIPPNHPAAHCDYYYMSDPAERAQAAVNDIEVHGGLTFCGSREAFLPGEARLRDWKFFGFDCGHAGDLSPAVEAVLREHRWTHQSPRAEEYRDLAYVRNEVAKLAEQLKAIEVMFDGV